MKQKMILFAGLTLALFFAGCSKTLEKRKMSKELSRLLKEQNFEMSAVSKGRFKGKKGTLIKIAENSFLNKEGKLYKGKVKVQLKEATNSLEIAASGIPMTYTTENGEETLFESAGMFYLNAKDKKGNQLSLAKGKNVEIQFPNRVTGKRFKVYFFDGKKWVYHGKNQIIGGGRRQVIGVRKYRIPRFGWYNWDDPRKVACIVGTMKNLGNRYVKIHSVGIDQHQTDWAYDDGKQFYLKGILNSKIKILFFGDKEMLGKSKIIKVWNKPRKSRKVEYQSKSCQNVGEITLKEEPKQDLKPVNIKPKKKKMISDYIEMIGMRENPVEIQYADDSEIKKMVNEKTKTIDKFVKKKSKKIEDFKKMREEDIKFMNDTKNLLKKARRKRK